MMPEALENNADNGPKCVLMAPYRVLAWLYKPLIPMLRRRYNTRFLLLVSSRSSLATEFAPLMGPRDQFIEAPDFFDVPKPVATSAAGNVEIFRKARENERRFGFSILSDIVPQERPIAEALLEGSAVRPGWLGSGRRKNEDPTASWAESVNSACAFFDALFNEHAIDAALLWPRSAMEAVGAYVALSHGVPVTFGYPTKHKNFAYWAHGPFASGYSYWQAYQLKGADTLPDDQQIAPPDRPKALESALIDKRYSLAGVSKEILKRSFHHLEFLASDFRRGRFVNRGRQPYLPSVARQIRNWRFYRRFSRASERNIERIIERPFVFFAFQNEPEFSVQGRCKEFHDQRTIVRHLARSLPSGYRLVIKEHTWLGARRADFYEELVSLPNVLMAHPAFRAFDLIPHASLVATLNGTVTLEAAYHAKPALIFSPRSEFSLLPSVTVATDLHALPKLLSEILDHVEQGDVAESQSWREAALRFASATESIGFPAAPMFDKTTTDVPEAVIERAADRLVERIASQYSPSQTDQKLVEDLIAI